MLSSGRGLQARRGISERRNQEEKFKDQRRIRPRYLGRMPSLWMFWRCHRDLGQASFGIRMVTVITTFRS
ncbi:hypothetical protein Dimus_003487, partial [Dionaea muscipula]